MNDPVTYFGPLGCVEGDSFCDGPQVELEGGLPCFACYSSVRKHNYITP